MLSAKWQPCCLSLNMLTHWGRVMHICVSKLTIIGSDNGLLPDWRQAIIWTNAGILLIGPLGTNFSEILIEILTFSFKKMRLKVSSAKRQPFCLGLNVLKCLVNTAPANVPAQFRQRRKKKHILVSKFIQMDLCNTVVSPFLTHWRYHRLTLSHQFYERKKVILSSKIFLQDPTDDQLP